MDKLIVICGPTATGKTELALQLARQFQGEIVSADSRQVYRGMDVGTGKEISNIKYQISKTQIKNQNFLVYKLKGVPVWLWDVVEPDQEFSVADYYDLAWKVIEDIWQRGKIPFLVGGTGFYLKAVVEGIGSLGIGPDWELRKKLSNLEIKKLREMLKKLDPQRWEGMNGSDRQNSRRLIRAIEIAEWREKESHDDTVLYHSRKLRPLFIGLTASYKVLYQRIDKRVKERVKRGAEQEVRQLLAQGYAWDLPAMSALGYDEWRPYLEKKASKREVIQRWQWNEHGYARKQMTWFRKNKKILWFDIAKEGFDKKIEKVVQSFLEAS